MKYIFFVGALGSGLERIAHDISGSLDSSQSAFEYSTQCTENFKYSKTECEVVFDSEFIGDGVRVIRSHTLANHINFLKENWPDCPVVLVHRSNDVCFNMIKEYHEFYSSYPTYDGKYKDLYNIKQLIEEQNLGITHAMIEHHMSARIPATNVDLFQMLKIRLPLFLHPQNYKTDGVLVKVI